MTPPNIPNKVVLAVTINLAKFLIAYLCVLIRDIKKQILFSGLLKHQDKLAISNQYDIMTKDYKGSLFLRTHCAGY